MLNGNSMYFYVFWELIYFYVICIYVIWETTITARRATNAHERQVQVPHKVPFAMPSTTCVQILASNQSFKIGKPCMTRMMFPVPSCAIHVHLICC